uniref:Uncharacterized protein n=1 Tax=Ciona intestinalis TaxID=7719 RepID=H2XLG2_CIOIN
MGHYCCAQKLLHFGPNFISFSSTVRMQETFFS